MNLRLDAVFLGKLVWFAASTAKIELDQSAASFFRWTRLDDKDIVVAL